MVALAVARDGLPAPERLIVTTKHNMIDLDFDAPTDALAWVAWLSPSEPPYVHDYGAPLYSRLTRYENRTGPGGWHWEISTREPLPQPSEPSALADEVTAAITMKAPDGSCNADPACTQRWGHKGVCTPTFDLSPLPDDGQPESKIWACPTPDCGYHIADGPVPEGEPSTDELIREHMAEHEANHEPHIQIETPEQSAAIVDANLMRMGLTVAPAPAGPFGNPADPDGWMGPLPTDVVQPQPDEPECLDPADECPQPDADEFRAWTCPYECVFYIPVGPLAYGLTTDELIAQHLQDEHGDEPTEVAGRVLGLR